MTHFSWAIDGSIVGLYLLATMIAGVMVRKYVGKVEHFLVAGREVNVYLGIASLAATEFGVITCMYTAQNGYKYGFAGATPGILMALAMFFVGVTGFCVKPLRDAGVMTIPELFEKRFGPRIRWAAGVVIVLGGLLNMGVFLRITGEFLVLVCGFDMADLDRNIVLMMTVAAAAGHDLHRGRRHALGAGHRLPAVHRDERGPDRRHRPDPACRRRLGAAWPTRWREHYAAGGFNPFVNPELGWQFVLFNALLNLAAVLTWQTTISRLLAAKDAKTGPADLHPHQLLLRLPLPDPGHLGHRRAGRARPDGAGRPAAGRSQAEASLYAMPRLLEPVRARRADGPAAGGHAGGRHVEHLLLHDHLGQRDLQRHPGPLPQDPLVGETRPALEPGDRHPDRRLPAVLRPLVSAEGRRLGLPGRDRHHLPGQHLDAADRLLLLEAGEQLGGGGGDHRRRRHSADLPGHEASARHGRHCAKQIGPYYSGIAAYVGRGRAMVVGSLLKPRNAAPTANRRAEQRMNMIADTGSGGC